MTNNKCLQTFDEIPFSERAQPVYTTGQRDNPVCALLRRLDHVQFKQVLVIQTVPMSSSNASCGRLGIWYVKTILRGQRGLWLHFDCAKIKTRDASVNTPWVWIWINHHKVTKSGLTHRRLFILSPKVILMAGKVTFKVITTLCLIFIGSSWPYASNFFYNKDDKKDDLGPN